jgi:hypothetical protein
VPATDPFASLVVRVHPPGAPDEGPMVVTVSDVCAGDGGDADCPHARATVVVQGTAAEIVALDVVPAGDGALTARLLDGVADALRARGVERIRITAELDL